MQMFCSGVQSDIFWFMIIFSVNEIELQDQLRHSDLESQD